MMVLPSGPFCGRIAPGSKYVSRAISNASINRIGPMRASVAGRQDSKRKMTRVAGTKAILIHGNGGSTAGDHWLPWLERELRALGVDVINHTFPDNIKARAQVWLPYLEQLDADENTILVGHSSGAVAA